MKISSLRSTNVDAAIGVVGNQPLRRRSYLSELLERLPAATTVEEIEALLPWNIKTILDARKRDL